jgi:hypothetical protein
MNVSEVQEFLASIKIQRPGMRSEVGTRDSTVYLRYSTDSEPEDFAVVLTPGDRWYELSVGGGFSTLRFDEGTPDDEVMRILASFAKAAIAYIEGHRTVVRSRILKLPSLRVEFGEESLDLGLSLADAVKWLFGHRNILLS